MRHTIAKLIVVLALAGAVTACGWTSIYPPAPERAAVAEYNYLIGPLDTLHILVWRNPDLSITVPVRLWSGSWACSWRAIPKSPR